MPLKSGEENRNFIERTIKLEKSQTESRGDKAVCEDNRKWKTSSKGVKKPTRTRLPHFSYLRKKTKIIS